MSGNRPNHASRRCAVTWLARWAGAIVLLALSPAGAATEAGGVQVIREEDGVRLLEAGRPVLFYRTRAATGSEAWRADYIHPLWSLAGAVLTEDAPADHVHHRGVFWAWRRILVEGEQVADGWVGSDVEMHTRLTGAQSLPDGSARIDAETAWIVTLSGRAEQIVAETVQIRAFPASDGTRRTDIEIGLRALRQGVALAGTADEKGYGGPSIRLAHPDEMDITSEGRNLLATIGPVRTGPMVRFRWRRDFPAWPREVALSCKVGGAPWTAWILRQELSMQNCAFPGSEPVTLPTDESLVLRFSITHD